MLPYLIKRLGSLIASLFVASLVIFACIEIVPGDPASFMLGVNAQPDTINALREELGLNTSHTQRYVSWISGLLKGDLGTSYTYRSPVSDIVADRLQVSVPLALYALTLTILIAFPVGVLAAAWRGSAVDLFVMGATQLGIAVPNFWFAILMVIVFAINLGWFSAGGFPGWDAGILAVIKALTLPAVALALPQASILARVMRSSLLDTLSEDYIRSARAKGLSRRQVMWRHALRNAMIPVLTIIGLQFSFLLAGAIIIDNVFFLPGLGRFVFHAITQRALIVVEGVVVLLVFAVVFVNFLVDLPSAWVVPGLWERL